MSWLKRNLAYELIEVDLKNKPEDLTRQNPYGKVPVLVDGGGVVYESAIIDEYLEEKFPEVPLMPTRLTAARQGAHLDRLFQ